MQIEVSLMIQLEVPDDTDLDNLEVEIDEDGMIAFSQGGEVIADGGSIVDYYLDDVSASDEEDEDDEDDEEGEEDEEDEEGDDDKEDAEDEDGMERKA